MHTFNERIRSQRKYTNTDRFLTSGIPVLYISLCIAGFALIVNFFFLVATLKKSTINATLKKTTINQKQAICIKIKKIYTTNDLLVYTIHQHII